MLHKPISPTVVNRRSFRGISSCFANIAIIGFIAIGPPAYAQSDTSEHASHHPADTTQEPKASSTVVSKPSMSLEKPTVNVAPKTAPAAPSSAAGMPSSMPKDAGMGAMGEMMKGMMGGAGEGCCGGATGTEIYPFLMSLPSMTIPQRAQVQSLALERIKEGKALLQVGHQRLAAATESGDAKMATAAAQQLRDGLGRVSSGMAAHEMLMEGTRPQEVATRWFKSEMSMSPASLDTSNRVHDISILHIIAMALLVVFAIAMVTMYFFKMRRTAALFGRIEAAAGKPPPGAAPALSGKPVPPVPNPPTLSEPSVQGSTAETASSPLSKGEISVADSGTSSGTDQTQLLGAKGSATAKVSAQDLLRLPNSKWSGRLEVRQIITETPSVKTIRLSATAGQATLPFTFLPGQFLNVAFSIGGARMNRSYSISSSPTQRKHLDLTIKRELRGAVSRHIDDLLRVGDEIEAGGPVGRFTFNGTEASSIVLISGGVGITPMMSISRYLTDQRWPNEIYFIYACRSPIDFIFAKDLADLERANPKLHVTAVMEHPEGFAWEGKTGRLSRELLAETVPDIISRRIHICGPPVMMDAVRALLAELKVPPEQVKTEDFGTAAPAPSADGVAKFAGPANGPLVNFSKNNKSSNIHEGQTLLELSEELGIGIEFSCRVGTCGVCKVKLTDGEVDMAIDDALDANDKQQGMILACQAKPKSAVTVEA